MAAYCDRQNDPFLLSTHNSSHDPTTAFQPRLPEQLDQITFPNPPFSEHHGRATPLGPLFPENNVVHVPYYEGYTMRPDDLASSDDRWSLPPRKSIPATQEDLHAEVIRQRQSGRTACRELEDCHGPKRHYIDRLIKERNASTSLGYFEVAQLRLERIPRDSGKASNRYSGRNYQARDHKQKDSAKIRQQTVYMHIILRFMKISKNLDEVRPDNFALGNSNVSNVHRRGSQPTSEEDAVMPFGFSNGEPSVLPEPSQRPVLARGFPYTTGIERVVQPPSSRYVSRGTQTAFPADTGPYSDRCSGDYPDDATLEGAIAEDAWTATTNTEEEMLGNPPSSTDEVASMGYSAAAREPVEGSTKKASGAMDEYEKPSWFQNLQPVKSPGIMNDQGDVCHRQEYGELSIPHKEKGTDDAREQDDEQSLKAHGEGNTDHASPRISSGPWEEIGQRSPDSTANQARRDDDDDQSADYSETEGAPIASEARRFETIDEHTSTGPANIPMSEDPLNLAGPPPQEKVPPSERYKPRPPLTPLPVRPSLTRSSVTYDDRPTEDSERKSAKRVSFLKTPTPPYTPPSTSTSSPVSPSASPNLPLRTILTKPPPVTIPPGQYTPIASSSSSSGSYVSPSSVPVPRKPYACLEPTCNSSFDHHCDRDRHERQHEIGDPPYSCCPICHYSRSGGAAVDSGVRELLIGHMNRRH